MMNTFTNEEIRELREGYSRLYSGVIYDTLHEDIRPKLPYVLSKDIRPAWDFQGCLCGVAFTVQGAVLTDKSNATNCYLDMLESMYDGCIEMISSGTRRKLSVFGEITGKIARRGGAVGTVIDACTRDINMLRKDGYPVFSIGVSMIDALDRWQIVDFQKPLPYDGEDGDVWINPGDYIFADGDGVLVIPHDQTFRVLEIAEERMIKENRIRDLIKEGVPVKEILKREGRW